MIIPLIVKHWFSFTDFIFSLIGRQIIAISKFFEVIYYSCGSNLPGQSNIFFSTKSCLFAPHLKYQSQWSSFRTHNESMHHHSTKFLLFPIPFSDQINANQYSQSSTACRSAAPSWAASLLQGLQPSVPHPRSRQRCPESCPS